MKKLWLGLSVLLGALSSQAFGQSHAMIDRSRASWQNNMFLIQSVEGEYGHFTKDFSGDAPSERHSWKGYGIRNGLGLEVYKFVQFSLAHTMFSTRSNASSLENAQGSKLAGEVALVFSAPIANVQIGYGLNLTHMNYQKGEENASLSGTGDYLSLGINYFLSSRLSLQVVGKRIDAHYRRDSGSIPFQSLQTKMDNFSLGLAVWF